MLSGGILSCQYYVVPRYKLCREGANMTVLVLEATSNPELLPGCRRAGSQGRCSWLCRQQRGMQKQKLVSRQN